MLILGLAEFSLKMFSLRSAENHGKRTQNEVQEQRKREQKHSAAGTCMKHESKAERPPANQKVMLS